MNFFRPFWQGRKGFWFLLAALALAVYGAAGALYEKAATAAAAGLERHLAGLPDTFTLNANGEKYEPVHFVHAAHASQKYGAGVQCQTCHHTQTGDEKPEKCETCHNVGGKAGEKKLQAQATHAKDKPFPMEADQKSVSCIGCHQAQNALLTEGKRSGQEAPTKCLGCHERKKGA